MNMIKISSSAPSVAPTAAPIAVSDELELAPAVRAVLDWLVVVGVLVVPVVVGLEPVKVSIKRI